ncbi:mitochondrial ribonuclease P protein 1 homolog [Anabrus simplex]|uniref:mitochondrial ribonuclease P protein 1 homolog n=1 Tax=Anabrus simplex TaxID=316456 RepID=UPI0034DD2512
MNNILRFRRMLPTVQCMSFIFQRVTESELRLSFYKTAYVNESYYPSRRVFSTHCRDTGNTESEVSDCEPVPNTEQIDLNTVTNGDPELEKRLKVLFLEVEVMRQEGDKVPANLNINHWKELINMATRSMRRKYLTFLWKNEVKKANEQKKKEEKKKIREEELNVLKQIDDGHIQYGLSRNSIFMRVYDSTITQFDNSRLIQAMQFGQKLVVDCGYDMHMTSRECMNCAKQLMLLFAENRFHRDPFNLYFCNIDRNGHTMKELHKYINTLYDDHFPLNITEKSYLDLFPKENLVYLTPHCREEMLTFDHDAVYIIGGIVDKVNKEPLSLAKAKKEGLRMAKLPLDRYLTWGSGSGKSLTLNQMIQILLDLRFTGDWKIALKHVPRRKITQDDGKFYGQFNKKGLSRNKVFSKYRTASFN